MELQVGLKQEIEVAMKLLEKDTHEKQDTLAALRLQLDQVKNLNLQMFNKAQVVTHDYTVSSSRAPTQTEHTLTKSMLLLRTQNEKQKRSRKKLCSWSRRLLRWKKP